MNMYHHMKWQDVPLETGMYHGADVLLVCLCTYVIEAGPESLKFIILIYSSNNSLIYMHSFDSK